MFSLPVCLVGVRAVSSLKPTVASIQHPFRVITPQMPSFRSPPEHHQGGTVVARTTQRAFLSFATESSLRLKFALSTALSLSMVASDRARCDAGVHCGWAMRILKVKSWTHRAMQKFQSVFNACLTCLDLTQSCHTEKVSVLTASGCLVL